MSDNLNLYWNEWDPPEDLHPVNTILYIDNLDASSTKKEILNLFSACGKVMDINIAVDRTSPNPCGFGFVTMATAEEARYAVRSLNRKLIRARILTVNEAYPSEPCVRSPKGRRTSCDLAAQHH
jgi:RNA recognition motif-containing protein